MGAYNFEILVEDSNTGNPSSITVRIECLFAFQFWYCDLCVKNLWEGRQKVLFCKFCFALIVVGWGVVEWGRKSYLGPAEIKSFVIASAKIKEIKRGGDSKISLCYSKVLRPSSQTLGKPMVVGFCSIVGWYSSEWWMWDLGTPAQFQRSKMRTRGQSNISSFV